MSSIVDWSRYRKCPPCGARLGCPCFAMTGSSVVLALKPHGTRRLRAGYARSGGER